jgi:hypothetical protein
MTVTTTIHHGLVPVRRWSIPDQAHAVLAAANTTLDGLEREVFADLSAAEREQLVSVRRRLAQQAKLPVGIHPGLRNAHELHPLETSTWRIATEALGRLPPVGFRHRSVDMSSPHSARRRGVVSGGGRGGVVYPAAASKAAFAVTHTFQAPLSLRR